jgi:hypothetical protein
VPVKIPRTAVVLASAALVCACTTTQNSHYLRWEALRADPTVRDWAHCIDEQIQLRITSALDPQPPTPEALDARGKTDGEIFVDILSACRRHMSGFGTNILADERNKRMLIRAYDQYRSVILEARVQEEAAIAN